MCVFLPCSFAELHPIVAKHLAAVTSKVLLRMHSYMYYIPLAILFKQNFTRSICNTHAPPLCFCWFWLSVQLPGILCWERALTQRLSSLVQMLVQPDFTLSLITLLLSLRPLNSQIVSAKGLNPQLKITFPSRFDGCLTSATLPLHTITIAVSKCANGFLMDSLASH